MFAILLVVCFINCALCLKGALSGSAEGCGVMSISANLIQGGYDSGRESFPWLVNIFTKYEGASLYAGSGSLISNRHILCAANSVAYENYLDDTLDLNPEQNYIAYAGKNVKVIFGSSHYKNAMEPGSLAIDGSSKVVLHPKVSGTRPRVFNVALIFLNDPVTFSDYISPVCISKDIDTNILGKTFYAVGFGVDHAGSISQMKKHIAMVGLDDATCQRFFRDTMNKGKAGKFFCARGNGLETPCRYDKPLYVKVDDRWYLQAMSSTFKVFKNKMCRPRAPVLYEDVTRFADWIDSEVDG